MKLNKWVCALVLAFVLCMVGSAAMAASFPDGTKTLQEVIDDAAAGETITITENISVGTVYINKDITIEGAANKNVTITATANRLFRISRDGSSDVNGTNYTVNFKNLTMTTAKASGRLIETRGGETTVNVDNCDLSCTAGPNDQPITVGGNTSDITTINIRNSKIDAGKTGYCVMAFNKTNLSVTDNTLLQGYAGIYMKNKNGSQGSAGSVIKVQDSELDCVNRNSDNGSNDFAAIVFEDDNITASIINSKINVEKQNDSAGQTAFLFSAYNDNEYQSTSNNNNVNFVNSTLFGAIATAGYDTNKVGNNTVNLQSGTFDAVAAAGSSSVDFTINVPAGAEFVDIGNGIYKLIAKSYSAPRTGDNSQIMLWAGLMIVSVLGMVAAKKRVAER